MAKVINSETKLTDVSFHTEKNKDGSVKQCFMSLTYVCEDDHYITETHIPKVEIPLDTDDCRVDVDRVPDYYGRFSAEICTLRGLDEHGTPFKLRMHEKDGCCYTTQIIKEKTVKMTVEEIEKKLGYSIEIVSNKKKGD